MDVMPWDAAALQVASDSKRTAKYRLLQSWYREQMLGLERHGFAQGSDRPVGNMLHVEDVVATPGLNLDPAAVEYALSRVDEVQASGGTAEKHRLQHNMLSSMPLCFSVFGSLRGLPDGGLDLVRELFDPEADRVEWIECEWKPEKNVLGDRTAFDAALLVTRRDRSRHLIGVETKYTEPFSAREYRTPRYQEVHESSRWFRADTAQGLSASRSNQLWRNTLLAAACEHSGLADRASVLVLGLEDDPGVAKAMPAMHAALASEHQDRCRFISLEALTEAASSGHGPSPEWAKRFRTRYLDLSPLSAGADGL